LTICSVPFAVAVHVGRSGRGKGLHDVGCTCLVRLGSCSCPFTDRRLNSSQPSIVSQGPTALEQTGAGSLSLSIPCVTLETAPLAARVRTSQVRSVVDTMADEHSRCDSSAKLCLSSETEHWPTSLGRAAIVEFSPSTSLPGVGWRDPRAGGVSTCAEFRF
jgi:hypothetical protein